MICFKNILILSIWAAMTFFPIRTANENINGITFIEINISQYIDDKESKQVDSIHEKKVNACKEYMEWSMKNQGYDYSTSKLSPEAIVIACEENEFSIAFTLAIANLESCFGQTPRAKKTNSVFSVGSFDNGKNKCTYSTQDESIDPFIKLIKKDYLLNGEKTINDLLSDGNFVNLNGHRYARISNYESQVKSIMKRITKMHPVLE